MLPFYHTVLRCKHQEAPYQGNYSWYSCVEIPEYSGSDITGSGRLPLLKEFLEKKNLMLYVTHAVCKRVEVVDTEKIKKRTL